jgi:hypothetical protein
LLGGKLPRLPVTQRDAAWLLHENEPAEPVAAQRGQPTVVVAGVIVVVVVDGGGAGAAADCAAAAPLRGAPGGGRGPRQIVEFDHGANVHPVVLAQTHDVVHDADPDLQHRFVAQHGIERAGYVRELEELQHEHVRLRGQLQDGGLPAPGTLLLTAAALCEPFDVQAWWVWCDM